MSSPLNRSVPSLETSLSTLASWTGAIGHVVVRTPCADVPSHYRTVRLVAVDSVQPTGSSVELNSVTRQPAEVRAPGLRSLRRSGQQLDRARMRDAYGVAEAGRPMSGEHEELLEQQSKVDLRLT